MPHVESHNENCWLPTRLRAQRSRLTAAIDKSRRQVSPDDRAGPDVKEVAFQGATELAGFGQPAGVQIGEGGENAVRGEGGENGLHNAILSIRRDIGPGKTADDV